MEDVSKCEYYSDNVGCYITFDGKCTKGNCFTYKLLQENKELIDFIKDDLAPTCQRLDKENDELRQCLDEIEKMCKHDCEYECSNDNTKCGICSCLEQRIQRKIKQAKENKNV